MTELAHCELLIMLSSFKLFFLLKCKLAYYESFLATVAGSIDSVCYNSKVPTKTQPEHEQSTVTTIPPSVYRCIICLDSLRLDTKTFYNSHYCGQQIQDLMFKLHLKAILKKLNWLPFETFLDLRILFYLVLYLRKVAKL